PVEAISELFEATGPGALGAVGITVALWAVSRGFHAVIRALDEAYDVVHRRNWFGVRALALALAFGTVIVAAITFTLLVVLPQVVDGLPGGGFLWLVLRPAGAVAILFGWALALYHVAPNHHTPLRTDIPGALFATCGWLVASTGFGIYVRQASESDQNVTGALGAVLSLVLLLFLLALVLLIGGEINGVLAHSSGSVTDGDPTLTTVEQLRRMKDWTTGRFEAVRPYERDEDLAPGAASPALRRPPTRPAAPPRAVPPPPPRPGTPGPAAGTPVHGNPGRGNPGHGAPGHPDFDDGFDDDGWPEPPARPTRALADFFAESDADDPTEEIDWQAPPPPRRPRRSAS
ncbi:MAG: YihY/virulence factor BrkB family protein, partial [Acidimicrobiia bacterium]|nr:YihY/virulence factor BrkB family protein [Acidimicrobiia bacterium]